MRGFHEEIRTHSMAARDVERAMNVLLTRVANGFNLELDRTGGAARLGVSRFALTDSGLLTLEVMISEGPRYVEYDDGAVEKIAH